jgi:hypothetical protein
LERAAGSWIVLSVGVPNEAGKHTTAVVRTGGRTGTGPSKALKLTSSG